MNQLYRLYQRSGISRWSFFKKAVIGTICVVSLFILFAMNSHKQMVKNSTAAKVSIMPKSTGPKKELNYNFIKLDTIKISNFPPAENHKNEITPPPEKTNTDIIVKELPKTPKTTRQILPQPAPVTPKISLSSYQKNSSKNPNMIVVNNLAKTSTTVSDSMTPITGIQSSLIKVVLPNRTPVANGSFVIARVLKDTNWGNTFIPKRTKLIGIASLFNRRVNIDFREIEINDKSRSCSGRAYDLKQLQGLPYVPVSSETKRILLEEIRDAVSGIPVVGRAANRATFSNNLNQDVSELDEGLEFYVLINSIF
ncbi:conjugative transposon protein TraM [candidate division KSB1 bacterium]|nr:conjugative transposon protein TraM [candidate division KSB1 bacterium]